MWEVLKILQHAVEFHLEPYVQLSSNISGTVTVWLELNNLVVKDVHPISYQSSVMRPQADIGTLFHEPQGSHSIAGHSHLKMTLLGLCVGTFPLPTSRWL
jgi:hypothetical protein